MICTLHVYSAEIIKEVRTNGPKLNELLKTPLNQLEDKCIDHALMAAVESGNYSSVGKLILCGASNIDKALEKSRRLRKHVVTAALLIIMAAMEDDKILILKLYGENVKGVDNKIPLVDEDNIADLQRIICSYTIKTVVPIEIARRNKACKVRKELLLRTDVDKESGTVLWHNLRLTQLEISWLEKIQWVKRLKLARNEFTSLPPEMGTYLKQCTKLDLAWNKLREVPCCLFELPSIHELNLSQNDIVEIPNVPEWSASLSLLDLSCNCLSSLPDGAVAPNLKNLNISNNKFCAVPHCVCSFGGLITLNISFNSKILSLPFKLGELKNLLYLNLDGLKDLSNPPRSACTSTANCILYLKNCLHTHSFYNMKLMVVGNQGVGKSTIATRLLGQESSDNQSTSGVGIREWKYNSTGKKETINFSVWDFVCEKKYYATHQCFLSKHSLYLLVWNVTEGYTGIADLKSWLDDISARVPGSCVIIVGVFEDDRQAGKLDDLVWRVQKLTTHYQHLSVASTTLVGLQENVATLKELIYATALDYKIDSQFVMGGKVPSSYHILAAKLATIRHKVKIGDHEPIMHAVELRKMVKDLNLVDLQDDRALNVAIKYLHEIGLLLHYNDHRCNLDDFYVIDPAWLCDFIFTLVTALYRSPHLKRGIIRGKNFIQNITDKGFFSVKNFQQCLTLLTRLEIAFAIDRDSKRIAIPSMFPETRPTIVDEQLRDSKDYHQRIIIFYNEDKSSCYSTPHGLWSRLLFRVMNHTRVVKETLRNCFEDDTWWITEKPLQDSKTSSSDLEKGSLAPTELAATSSRALDHQESCDIFSMIKEHENLVYWDKGLFFNNSSEDSGLIFIIESFVKTIAHQKRDGISVMCSNNQEGRKVLGELTDLVEQLISEWYPGLSKGLDQKVPCHECIRTDSPNPYEFKVDHLLSLVAENDLHTECGRGHKVQLTDLVPDLVLADVDPSFILDANDLVIKKEKNDLLGRGAFSEVYHGAYKGQSVIVKLYAGKENINLKKSFMELRSESKMLQVLYHPCLICMVGVTVHPTISLVVEEASLGTLWASLISEQRAFSRIVMYRIAIQVASALRFLHSIDIIFNDLQAENVLLWSQSPDYLLNCKLKFTHYSDLEGSGGIHCTTGFIAPEVANIGHVKEHSVYDHRANTFSYGMFLYQLIARRDPFHDLQPDEIEAAIEAGQRPQLEDIPVAEVGYYYMTRVMKQCWAGDANERPPTQMIVEWLSHPALQLIMSVVPMMSKYSIRNGCIIIPSYEFGIASKSTELWICCDGNEGIELSSFNTNTMIKAGSQVLKHNQAQCMKQCGDHIWLASRAGLEHGVIDIFDKNKVHIIRKTCIDNNAVSCIASSKDLVYIGTMEGCIFSFPIDIQANQNAQFRYVSVYRIDGIVIASDYIWVSTYNHINFVKPDNLVVEDVIKREKNAHPLAFVGKMMLSDKGDQVWSAHLGGVVMSSWNAHQRVHLCDVDVDVVAEEKCHVGDPEDQIITAMCIGLDTVWIGLASGHIIVFGMNPPGEVLTYFRPYHSYVRFLSSANCLGPCGKEECMMLSGGKMYQPGDDFKQLSDYLCKDRFGQPVDNAGAAILWEVLPAKYMRQIDYLGEGTSYLNYSRFKETMTNTGFTDYKVCSSLEEYELIRLLTKLYPGFLLDFKEVNYKKNREHLLGKKRVCQGEYKGQSVIIKLCTADERNIMEEFLRELCSAGKMLQQLHHPCVAYLLGITAHLTTSLVIEAPSCGILHDVLLKREHVIPRVVAYRIAIQVASALSYLHDNNVICYHLTTDNILLWSLSPECLINCKLIAFNINPVQNDPNLTTSKVGSDGVANSCYSPNICSFGTFLYQLMVHRCNVQQFSELPELQNIPPVRKTSLFYMQKLHNSHQKFSSSKQIAKWLSVPTRQLVMTITTVKGNHTISHGCITQTVISKTTSVVNSIELWICCNGVKQSELSIFEAEKVKNVSLGGVQLNYMKQCGNFIWMSSQDDVQGTMIHIFCQHLQSMVYEIKAVKCSVSCATNSDWLVYIGTEEGYCFAIPMDIQAIDSDIWLHHHKCVTEYCIDGVLLTQTHLWVSSCDQIYLLNPNSLEVEGVVKRKNNEHACVGKMMLCDNGDEVWSAHLGGVIMSSWDAHQCVHLCDVDVGVIAEEKCHVGDPRDQIITAMCTGLDTVWIGLASGHIIVFGMNPPGEVLTYFRPYQSYVCFLSSANYPGPCGKEECMMLSGGKTYQPDDSFKELSCNKDKSGHPVDTAGVAILWEVLPAKYVRQVHYLRDGKAWLSYDTISNAMKNT